MKLFARLFLLIAAIIWQYIAQAALNKERKDILRCAISVIKEFEEESKLTTLLDIMWASYKGRNDADILEQQLIACNQLKSDTISTYDALKRPIPDFTLNTMRAWLKTTQDRETDEEKGLSLKVVQFVSGVLEPYDKCQLFLLGYGSPSLGCGWPNFPEVSAFIGKASCFRTDGTKKNIDLVRIIGLSLDKYGFNISGNIGLISGWQALPPGILKVDMSSKEAIDIPMWAAKFEILEPKEQTKKSLFSFAKKTIYPIDEDKTQPLLAKSEKRKPYIPGRFFTEFGPHKELNLWGSGIAGGYTSQYDGTFHLKSIFNFSSKDDSTDWLARKFFKTKD